MLGDCGPGAAAAFEVAAMGEIVLPRRETRENKQREPVSAFRSGLAL